MTTQTITNPVRSDVAHPPTTESAATDTPAGSTTVRSRTWALAGLAAGVAGTVGIVLNGVGNQAVYDPATMSDPELVRADLADHVGVLVGSHVGFVLAAVLLVPFAAGLHRRLADRMPGSTAPLVAFAGLLGTAVVLVMGSGLDTEVVFGVGDDGPVGGDLATFYGHWIGTIPWVWCLAGLAAVATYAAGRAGAVPRWLGRTGLVLGGVVLLAGVSPMQYLAIVPGLLWLLVTGAGFAFGDREHRVGPAGAA